jgi:hypothetical protein
MQKHILSALSAAAAAAFGAVWRWHKKRDRRKQERDRVVGCSASVLYCVALHMVTFWSMVLAEAWRVTAALKNVSFADWSHTSAVPVHPLPWQAAGQDYGRAHGGAHLAAGVPVQDTEQGDCGHRR